MRLTRTQTAIAAAAALAVCLVATVLVKHGLNGPVLRNPISADVVLKEAGHTELRNDPDAPLASGISKAHAADRMGWSNSIAIWHRLGDQITFGVDVCLRTSGPITITAVEPVATVGDGFALAGAWVFRSAADQGMPVISFTGNPARRLAPGSLTKVPKAQFDFKCSNGAPSQVLFSLKATGPDGGGWDGARIRYLDSDGAERALEAPVYGTLCGASTRRCDERP